MAKSAAEHRPAFKARSAANPYEHDFFRWTQRQAALLRAANAGEIDWENLAEEIESLGKRDRRELGSRLQVLLAHLLKWEIQPEKRSRSWSDTIDAQRTEIALIVADSPSLERQIPALVEDRYPGAKARAARQARLPEARFPKACPYTTREIVDEAFLPGRKRNGKG